MKMNFRFAYDYINIIDRVQNCIDTDSDSEDKAIIYTYYIRLLIGLYKQYGYEMKKKDRLIELERMYLHLMRIYGDNQKISVAGDDIIFEI